MGDCVNAKVYHSVVIAVFQPTLYMDAISPISGLKNKLVSAQYIAMWEYRKYACVDGTIAVLTYGVL
jgi:hypothetical protein